jgi:hypothetical protein
VATQHPNEVQNEPKPLARVQVATQDTIELHFAPDYHLPRSEHFSSSYSL